MIAELIDTSSWTYEQWLAAIILAFIVISVIVFLYRMFQLFRFARKPRYVPNLRPLRRKRIRQSAVSHDLDDDQTNNGNTKSGTKD